MPPYKTNAAFYKFGSLTPSPSLTAAAACGLTTVPQLVALAAQRAVRRTSPGAPTTEQLDDTTLIGALLAPEMPHSLACQVVAVRLMARLHYKKNWHLASLSRTERFFLPLRIIANAILEKLPTAAHPETYLLDLGHTIDWLITPEMKEWQAKVARHIPENNDKRPACILSDLDYLFAPAPHQRCGAPGTLGELVGMPIAEPNEAKNELGERGMSVSDMIALAEEYGVVRDPGNWSADDPRRRGFMPRKLVSALLSLDNPMDKRCITAAAEVLPRTKHEDYDYLRESAINDHSFWLLQHLAATGLSLVKDSRWHCIAGHIEELTEKIGIPSEVKAWLPDVTRPMSHVSVGYPELEH